MTSFEWIRSLMPEDRFLCCICFESKSIEEAHVDDEGTPWDICEPCQVIEQEFIEQRRVK